MENYPLISVIVPVYNVEQYIERCLDSILNQTYRNLKVILIDDGSTDKSGTICDKYGDKDSRVVVFHKENAGPGIARNIGLNYCKEYIGGGYITFVDSDDWIETEMYEILVRYAQDTGCDVAGCATMTDREDGVSYSTFADREDQILSGKSCSLDLLYQTKYAWGAMYNKLYSANLFDDIRFPPISNLEDYVISAQIYSKIDRIAFCKRPMYHYTIRKESLSKSYSKNKVYAIDSAKLIQKFFQECVIDEELDSATYYFVYLTYIHILWEIYKKKPDGWKTMIRSRKKGMFYAFVHNLLCSKKKMDIRKIVQMMILIVV